MFLKVIALNYLIVIPTQMTKWNLFVFVLPLQLCTQNTIDASKSHFSCHQIVRTRTRRYDWAERHFVRWHGTYAPLPFLVWNLKVLVWYCLLAGIVELSGSDLFRCCGSRTSNLVLHCCCLSATRGTLCDCASLQTLKFVPITDCRRLSPAAFESILALTILVHNKANILGARNLPRRMMLLENSAQLFAEIHTEILLGLTVMLVLRIIIKYFADRPKIPGPFPWPVIGNAISLGDKPHVAMQNMAKRCVNHLALWWFTKKWWPRIFESSVLV